MQRTETRREGRRPIKNAIEILRELEANGFLGRAYLDLGLFYKFRKRTDLARECISEAIKIFEECEVEVYLKQAKIALKS